MSFLEVFYYIPQNKIEDLLNNNLIATLKDKPKEKTKCSLENFRTYRTKFHKSIDNGKFSIVKGKNRERLLLFFNSFNIDFKPFKVGNKK